MKIYKKIVALVMLLTLVISLTVTSQGLVNAATTSSASCNPTLPVAGKDVTITYNAVGGVLQAASTINMHWGYDGWKGSEADLPMTKVNGVWTVTFTVPAAATSAINACFTDGKGNWDSNIAGKNWNFLFTPAVAPVITPGTITDITINPGSNPTNLNFCWYSYQTEGDSEVQVALKSDMTGTDFPEAKAKTFVAQKSNGNDGYTSNKATATDLKESTQYVYRVGSANNFSAVYNFTTHKTSDFSFLVAGDPQLGASGDINADSKGWATTIDAVTKNFSDASFLLSVGDEVNNGGELNGNTNESEYTGFFAPSALRSLPVSAYAGNHETDGVGHIYHFNNPNMSSQYGTGTKEPTTGGDYYFTYGNTLIMALNSNDTNEAGHKAFMQAAIKANPQATWKVVTFHHAPYSSANHATDGDILDRRSTLVPILDDLGIDVVLNGHDHNYTRSNFMKGGSSVLNQNVDNNGTVLDPKGTLYITANSASGSKFYEFNSKLDKSYVAKNEQNHQAEVSSIKVTNNSFTITTYHVADMSVVDTISIAKTNVADDATVAVMSSISALPDASVVTVNDNAAVQAARVAYTALNATEQALVSNISKLTADETKIAQLQAAAQQPSSPATPASTTTATDITSNSVVSKDVFNNLKGQDKTITFNGNNVTWTFNGKDITSALASDIDLSLKAVSADLKNKEAAKVKAVTGKDANIVPFSFKYDGPLPGNATVKVFIGKDWANKKVSVCRYYSDKNTYEVVTTATIDANGYLTYTTNHCSDYFVTDALNMPQTGSFFDEKLIIAIGTLITLLGAAIVLASKFRKIV